MAETSPLSKIVLEMYLGCLVKESSLGLSPQKYLEMDEGKRGMNILYRNLRQGTQGESS